MANEKKPELFGLDPEEWFTVIQAAVAAGTTTALSTIRTIKKLKQ